MIISRFICLEIKKNKIIPEAFVKITHLKKL